MKDKLQYNTNIERAYFVVKYQGQNLIDDLPNKIIYCLDNNEYFENGEIKVDKDYKQKELAKAKEAKHIENLDTANNKQQNSIIEYKDCLFETSDSNRGNLRDTSEGLEKGLVTKVVWLTKDDAQLEVTLEDVVTVRSMILQFINNLWNTTYLNYKKAIDRCTTKEEVDSIIINYDSEE